MPRAFRAIPGWPRTCIHAHTETAAILRTSMVWPVLDTRRVPHVLSSNSRLRFQSERGLLPWRPVRRGPVSVDLSDSALFRGILRAVDAHQQQMRIFP